MSTRQGSSDDSLFGFNLSYNVGDDEQRVATQRHAFFAQLGLSEDHVAAQRQIHETTITHVTEGGIYPDSDALVTHTPMVGLAISAADCIPVLLYAPGDSVIAAVHAGWRGTVQRISEKTIGYLRDNYGIDPATLFGFIAPGAGVCCYEVGEEVASQFVDGCVRQSSNGPRHVDLKEANRRQLIDAGMRAENIDASDFCTICRPSIFHSHRRDGSAAGRMLAVIGMKEEA